MDMRFSYGKFLENLHLSKAKRNNRQTSSAPQQLAGHAAAPARPAMSVAVAAVSSLQDQAAALPTLPSTRTTVQDDGDAAARLEKLLTCLWRMADNLAQIRAEFHTPASSADAASDDLEAIGGYPNDEPHAVIAHVDALERTICSIADVVSGTHSGTHGGTDSGKRMAASAAPSVLSANDPAVEIAARTGEAVRQLRLQAVRLATAVHAHRAALALTHSVIARARR